MKSLGNISRGSDAIAKEISENALEHGRIAVYIGETGGVAFVTHHEAGYDGFLVTHSSRLVGVYQGNASGTGECHPEHSIFAVAMADLEHWMGFIRVPPKPRARVERREVA
ncbi:hypothetical protein [Frateuria aurantia]|uniref:Uncharacterized protein n=1 Tax=Frateuria aurantia (strain ATCC 33424 / DSM 6220 / KCTC 2777 / LMG 1558 / NBRC 3245 / NCIMB 13370) TaxID=767434 RepID=H8L631_FRAAD|nr:hypothetical protein [Frateuria aurantia]AFC85875.1 hypothetical protein Fraau_1452 [Frateuria aurantia DSM 6220]